MEIERAFDEVVGLAEPLHALRAIRSRDDHLVTFPCTLAADLAPHLLTFSLEDPQHLELYRAQSDRTAERALMSLLPVTFLAGGVAWNRQ